MSHRLTLERPGVKIHVCCGDWVTKSPLWWPVWHYLERLLRDLISFPPHSKCRRLFHHKRADLQKEMKRSHLTNVTSEGTWKLDMVKLVKYDMTLQIKLVKSAVFLFWQLFTLEFLSPRWGGQQAGWESAWENFSGLPLPAVSPHPACYCYCS